MLYGERHDARAVPRDRAPRRSGGEKGPLTIGALARLDFTRHERGVLAPLSLTGFFEIYDVALLTLAAPVIAQGLGVGLGVFALGVALIRLASLASVPVLRLADRIGRRKVLYISLAMFSLATGLTSLAVGLVTFVILQMLARVFLATESAVAGLVIAEELRPHRRGAGLSVLGVLSGIGFGAAGVMLLAVPHTPLDWRLLYLVALVPLGVVAYLRRNLRETTAFVTARGEGRLQKSFWPRVGREHRPNLLRATGLLGAFGVVQTTGFFYASDLAQTRYGWDGRFTAVVIVAGIFGVLGFYLGGRVSDRLGRKPMVAVAVVLATVGTSLMFTTYEPLFIPGFFALTAAAACFLSVSVAYVAELFPTEIRATSIAFVTACEVAAGSVGLGLLGGLSGVVSPSLMMLILGGMLVLSLALLRRMPEVRGRDLIQSGGPPPPPAAPSGRRPVRVGGPAVARV